MDSRMDGFSGAAPVLTIDILARIHQLNGDFLELLVDENASRALSRDLPPRVQEALRKAPPEVRERIAASSFTLYSLGFEDQEFWRSALRADTVPIDCRYGSSTGAAMQSPFCEVALLHAWHIAVSHPIAARVLYGMPSPVIDGMSRARLWQLRRIAVDYPGLLMPRWRANPCFWPEMIRFASLGDTRRVHTLQQLGHQLIAADLHASGDKHNPTLERQRNLLKQRLARP